MTTAINEFFPRSVWRWCCRALAGEAFAEAGINQNWVAGVSIGAFNAAIIAGNAPETRVDRLREFWTHITSDWCGIAAAVPWVIGDNARNLFKTKSARSRPSLEH
jgi:NTE family protein